MGTQDNDKTIIEETRISYRATKTSITKGNFEKYDPDKLEKIKQWITSLEFKKFNDSNKSLVVITDDINDTSLLVQTIVNFVYKAKFNNIKNYSLHEIFDWTKNDGFLECRYLLNQSRITAIDNFQDQEIKDYELFIRKDKNKDVSDILRSYLFNKQSSYILGVTLGKSNPVGDISDTEFWCQDSLINLIRSNMEVIDVRRS
jgi:hypothetical protein